MTDEIFPENLKLACRNRRSISEVCREIGLNRQQFNRYVNGTSRPSRHNLTRIAAYFGLEPEDFDLPTSQFRQRLLQAGDTGAVEFQMLREGFPGNLTQLRSHLGYYQTFHLSLSWPDRVVCSCARLEERKGLVHVKSIERIRDEAAEISQFSKYVGQAAFWRNRIFIVERTVGETPLIAQTILIPFGEHQRTYLKGMSMGVSWRQQNLPYASRMIWQFLGSHPDKRAMLGRCGALDLRSRRLPPIVQSYLFENDTVARPLAAG